MAEGGRVPATSCRVLIVPGYTSSGPRHWQTDAVGAREPGVPARPAAQLGRAGSCRLGRRGHRRGHGTGSAGRAQSRLHRGGRPTRGAGGDRGGDPVALLGGDRVRGGAGPGGGRGAFRGVDAGSHPWPSSHPAAIPPQKPPLSPRKPLSSFSAVPFHPCCGRACEQDEMAGSDPPGRRAEVPCRSAPAARVISPGRCRWSACS
jgi:hypothetical protein